jgi:hypothetical protein
VRARSETAAEVAEAPLPPEDFGAVYDEHFHHIYRHISRSATPSAWDVRRSTPAMKRYDAGMAKRCAKRPPGACPPVPPTTEQPVPAARESGGGHRVRHG